MALMIWKKCGINVNDKSIYFEKDINSLRWQEDKATVYRGGTLCYIQRSVVTWFVFVSDTILRYAKTRGKGGASGALHCMLMQKQRFFFPFFLFIVLFSFVNLLSVEDFDIFMRERTCYTKSRFAIVLIWVMLDRIPTVQPKYVFCV